MNKAFEGATHIWTPAFENQHIIRGVFRRYEFRKQQNGWYSKTVDGRWVESLNPHKWFDGEIAEGFLVTVDEFSSPNFVIKPEYQK